ncbi:MAG: DNA-processing protein DprA [Bacillota bacterium]
MNQDSIYWAALSSLKGMGPKRIMNAVRYFGGPQAAWDAPAQDWTGVPDIVGEMIDGLAAQRAKLDLEQLALNLERLAVTVVTIEDPKYPKLLKEIHAAPIAIYVRGQLQSDDTPTVAIVGSRKATHYGRTIAAKLAGELASMGVTVVSGLARGIDASAHLGALQAGTTYAVMGTGPDIIYPQENERLAAAISDRGALITEYLPGTPPHAAHFPARNRIISGLALGTLVVEAQETSGSLITADYALEQNREVFAVPGNILSPTSRGCHRLLKQGARLVEGIEDIVDELRLKLSQRAPLESGNGVVEVPLTASQCQILDLLSLDPLHLDLLVRQCAMPMGRLLSELTQLELLGVIRQLPGRHYVRI